MKGSPVSPAAKAGTEPHLFGDTAGEDDVEFGVKVFFMVEEAPRVKHFDGYSAAGSGDSVNVPPQTVVCVGLLPCRGYGDRCNAPTAVGAKPH